jgi:hypothetical protein
MKTRIEIPPEIVPVLTDGMIARWALKREQERKASRYRYHIEEPRPCLYIWQCWK